MFSLSHTYTPYSSQSCWESTVVLVTPTRGQEQPHGSCFLNHQPRQRVANHQGNYRDFPLLLIVVRETKPQPFQSGREGNSEQRVSYLLPYHPHTIYIIIIHGKNMYNILAMIYTKQQKIVKPIPEKPVPNMHTPHNRLKRHKYKK